MWSAISFLFVVVVPVCATAALTNRWLRSIHDAQDGLDDAETIRRISRDMSERLKNLELMLASDRLRDNGGDQM